MSAVGHFQENRAGRDFIVGDVHGCISLLGQALRGVGFSPITDRLFSVGDLIDRGRESHRVLELLQLPWFHAVAGNHELMLLQAVEAHGIEASSLAAIFLRNGLAWWLEVEVATRQRIVEAIKQLPLAIEVETGRGRVGIVHASVPPGLNWQAFCAGLAAGDASLEEYATWSRDRIREGDASGVQGIDRVFVGHTPGNQVRRLGNIYFVDTGAVFGLMGDVPAVGLTVANLMCATSMLEASSADANRINLLPSPAAHGRPFTSFVNQE